MICIIVKMLLLCDIYWPLIDRYTHSNHEYEANEQKKLFQETKLKKKKPNEIINNDLYNLRHSHKLIYYYLLSGSQTIIPSATKPKYRQRQEYQQHQHKTVVK